MAYEQRNNEGTLWPQPNSGPSGDGMFYDRTAYLMLGRTGAKSEAAPTHRLIVIFKDDGTAMAIAMFQPKKVIENLLVSGQTDEHFVSIWQNKSDSGKVYLRVTFKDKDGVPKASNDGPDEGDGRDRDGYPI
jgi:hypothetical protein